jgi:hypothetical protein
MLMGWSLIKHENLTFYFLAEQIVMAFMNFPFTRCDVWRSSIRLSETVATTLYIEHYISSKVLKSIPVIHGTSFQKNVRYRPIVEFD